MDPSSGRHRRNNVFLLITSISYFISLLFFFSYCLQFHSKRCRDEMMSCLRDSDCCGERMICEKIKGAGPKRCTRSSDSVKDQDEKRQARNFRKPLDSRHKKKKNNRKKRNNENEQSRNRKKKEQKRARTSSPSFSPSYEPSTSPSFFLSTAPSLEPTKSPSVQPSLEPSSWQSLFPSVSPSFEPSTSPTFSPMQMPVPVQPKKNEQNGKCKSQNKPCNNRTVPCCIGLTCQRARCQRCLRQQAICRKHSECCGKSLCQGSWGKKRCASGEEQTKTTKRLSKQPSEQPSQFPTASPSNQPSQFPSASPSTVPSISPSSSPSASCRAFSQRCTLDDGASSRCCDALKCLKDPDDGKHRCKRCRNQNMLCSRTFECCPGLACVTTGNRQWLQRRCRPTSTPSSSLSEPQN